MNAPSCIRSARCLDCASPEDRRRAHECTVRTSRRGQRAAAVYLREIAYEQRVKLALFRLDIDHVLIFGHLTQELLKLATAFRAYLAFELGQCLVDCLRRGR